MTESFLMLDICCGLKGASQVMKDRGWEVLTLDVNEKFDPDIVADVRHWHYSGDRPDLVWCSPPCTEFARESMPWCRTGRTPDLSIYLSCRQIIKEVGPKYWVIENVRGAVKYFGKPVATVGPFYFWGSFPDIGKFHLANKNKSSMSSNKEEERAKIPVRVSRAFALAVELNRTLFD